MSTGNSSLPQQGILPTIRHAVKVKCLVCPRRRLTAWHGASAPACTRDVRLCAAGEHRSSTSVFQCNTTRTSSQMGNTIGSACSQMAVHKNHATIYVCSLVLYSLLNICELSTCHVPGVIAHKPYLLSHACIVAQQHTLLLWLCIA